MYMKVKTIFFGDKHVQNRLSWPFNANMNPVSE
jgi:hypothetical protein